MWFSITLNRSVHNRHFWSLSLRPPGRGESVVVIPNSRRGSRTPPTPANVVEPPRGRLESLRKPKAVLHRRGGAKPRGLLRPVIQNGARVMDDVLPDVAWTMDRLFTVEIAKAKASCVVTPGPRFHGRPGKAKGPPHTAFPLVRGPFGWSG